MKIFAPSGDFWWESQGQQHPRAPDLRSFRLRATSAFYRGTRSDPWRGRTRLWWGHLSLRHPQQRVPFHPVVTWAAKSPEAELALGWLADLELSSPNSFQYHPSLCVCPLDSAKDVILQPDEQKRANHNSPVLCKEPVFSSCCACCC